MDRLSGELEEIYPEIVGYLSSIETLEGDLTAESDIELVGELSNEMPEMPIYTGPYVVTPLADQEVTMETRDKTMYDDVTVREVPYYETTNESGGYTVYIAGTIDD